LPFCSSQADDGRLVEEDGDHVAAPLDLAVEPFQRVGRVDLLPVVRRVERNFDTFSAFGANFGMVRCAEAAGMVGPVGSQLN
jgi:hypothetical protein